jgi:squalene-hopene/tetraprenyl-beta-curcumene cyclase
VHPPLRPVIWTLTFLLLALRPGAVRGAEPAAWSPKAAAEYLDARADWWLSWSGSARGRGTACLSCHTAVPFALARPALDTALGETVGTSEQRLFDGVRRRVERWADIVGEPAAGGDALHPYYSKERKPSALGTEAVLNALVLVSTERRRGGGPLSATAEVALGHLWEQQQPSGAWRWLEFGLNPWEKDGTYYGAALAAVAVGTAGPEYLDRADVRPRVDAVKQYLRTAYAEQPLHHRVAGLWASGLLPGALAERDATNLVAELFAAQRADGGWDLASLGRKAIGGGGWKPRAMYSDGTVSDGYATGLVVLALKRSGVPAEQPNLRRAVDWLANHQAGGSWPATYPNSWRDPRDNIGKFMRDAATGFAVLALTEANATGPAKGLIAK